MACTDPTDLENILLGRAGSRYLAALVHRYQPQNQRLRRRVDRCYGGNGGSYEVALERKRGSRIYRGWRGINTRDKSDQMGNKHEATFLLLGRFFFLFLDTDSPLFGINM